MLQTDAFKRRAAGWYWNAMIFVRIVLRIPDGGIFTPISTIATATKRRIHQELSVASLHTYINVLTKDLLPKAGRPAGSKSGIIQSQ
jgi:hypothetical protein